MKKKKKKVMKTLSVLVCATHCVLVSTDQYCRMWPNLIQFDTGSSILVLTLNYFRQPLSLMCSWETIVLISGRRRVSCRPQCQCEGHVCGALEVVHAKISRNCH